MNIILVVSLIGLAYGVLLGSFFTDEGKSFLVGLGVGLVRVIVIATLAYGVYLLIK